MADTLKIISLNVQGFRNPVKQAEVISVARAEHCDVLCLQETNFFTIGHVRAFKRSFNLDCYFSFATSRFSGVGIIIFNRALLRDHHVFYDGLGRVLVFDCVLSSFRLRILSIYGPAQAAQSNDFFRDLDVYFLDGRHVILTGDFNCVLDTRADVQGPGWGRPDWNARELRRLVQHFSLIDAYRLVHGSQYAWTCGVAHRLVGWITSTCQVR